MAELGRRDFFSFLGSSAALKAPMIRPPYAGDAMRFGSVCLTCNDKACVNACEEHIIRISDKGTPYLDFGQSGCTYCEACLKACTHEVLYDANAPIRAHVLIDTQKCMSHHGVICFTCKEPCLEDAILFSGLYRPVIESEKCTACGFCLSRCPSGAIVVTA